jgi:hypothetical protein
MNDPIESEVFVIEWLGVGWSFKVQLFLNVILTFATWNRLFILLWGNRFGRVGSVLCRMPMDVCSKLNQLQ